MSSRQGLCKLLVTLRAGRLDGIFSVTPQLYRPCSFRGNHSLSPVDNEVLTASGFERPQVFDV